MLLKRLLLLLLNLGLFVLLFGMLTPDAHPGAPEPRPVYGSGTAQGRDRAQVEDLLQRFADGYAARKTAEAGTFVESLFTKEDPLVLGTLPREVFRGPERVKAVVAGDWADWGTCRFAVAGARIAQKGDVAWFALRGRVAFDLSRFLIVPLRLTGVAVREGDGWRLQQVQFQFDVDLSRTLAALLLLLVWMAWNLACLGREGWLRFRRSQIPSREVMP